MENILYNLVIHTVVPPFLALYYVPKILLRGKYRSSLGGKLGRLPEDFHPDSVPRPRIWFHAVSVGEVVALRPLVEAVKEMVPQAGIVISTGTETGQERARSILACSDGFIYLPLDYPAFVNRVVSRIDPDLFVLMETELWPNLISGLKRNNTPIALANGRISDRSFPRYRKLRPLLAPILGKIDVFLMASQTDSERIVAMGADPRKTRVTGNTKFDAALGREIPREAEGRIRQLFGIDKGTPVLVAGSTHPGENEIVLEAFEALTRDFPDLTLVLVPRHVERTPEIVAAIAARGLPEPFLRSWADSGRTREDRSIVIVDRTGELFQVYSIASAVFMGGSLAPKGGQNIVEPAAWGKMVMFGPSMEDFREARDALIAAGAGIEVRGAGDLVREVTGVLSDPAQAKIVGERGRTAVMKHVGSAKRSAEILRVLLGKSVGHHGSPPSDEAGDSFAKHSDQRR